MDAEGSISLVEVRDAALKKLGSSVTLYLPVMALKVGDTLSDRVEVSKNVGHVSLGGPRGLMIPLLS